MKKIISRKRPVNPKKTFQRLFKYLFQRPGQFLLIIFLVILSAGANIFGTYLIKFIIDDYIVPGNLAGLYQMILWMILLYGVGIIATIFYPLLMINLSQKIIAQIREELFIHVQDLPLGYFIRHKHGEIMSYFTNDMDTLNETLNSSFTQFINSLTMTVLTLLFMFLINVYLSLIVLFFLFLMLLFIIYNSRKSGKYFSYQQKSLSAVNGYVEEMIVGQKVVKMFQRESANFAEFNVHNEELRQHSTVAFEKTQVNLPIIVSLSYFNFAISAVVGAIFSMNGIILFGALTTYLIYVRQASAPFNSMAQQTNAILAGLAGAERIFSVLDRKKEIDQGQTTLVNVKKKDNDFEITLEKTGQYAWKKEDGTLIPFVGDVRFIDVTFFYKEGETILDDVSLYARPGEKIAFVGATGAGKTTIINLITRFYEIQKGTITYDGIDIREIKKADLRRSLSLVIQETNLFTGTILDNIRYARPEASFEEVEAASKIANADFFISHLPEGYQTMLYDNGNNLSSGQRQLIALARAAIVKPPVLILDEATSNIDTRTEKLIEKAMDKLMEGRTVFVIAHRLSTIRNAKAILVLSKGNIIERGSHDDLITRQGIYYHLYIGQFEWL